MLENVALEAAMLGALMFDDRALDAVSEIIDSSHFQSALHGRIFNAIAHELSLGRQANPITIKGYFEDDPDLKTVGGIGYLAQLYNETGAHQSPRAVAEQIADLASRRRMQAGLSDAALGCADLNTSIADIVSFADDALAIRGADKIHQPTGADCIAELIASYDAPSQGVQCRQIKPLDDLLGPLRPKQLVIMAGRPGMGKTAVALSYAIGAAKAGHGVLFVSLEMSSTELGARMAADLCFDGVGVPFNKIRDGNLSDYQKREVASASSRMRGHPLQVVDAGGLTLGRLNMLIRRHVRRMDAAGFALELVIVDYLQLLRTDSKGRSNYEDVSEVSRTLKEMAKQHGVAIMAMAQLSREVEKRQDKRPQLSDLRDSGQIEQDADAVLFLLRPEYYLHQEEPEPSAPEHLEWQSKLDNARGMIEFILAKRRNGEVGNAYGKFHGAYQAVRGEDQ